MNIENIDSHYPRKPILIRKKNTGHIAVTIFSIVLFALTFSFILNDYYLISLLLGVLIFHEGGHYIMMKIFKYEELNMLFIPFMGAMVSGKKKIYSQVQSSIMVLAGPIPGILVGVFLLINPWFELHPITIQLGVILILLNVLNLVPIEPLDGGQLMRNLFFSNYEFSQLIFSILSSLSFMVIGLLLNSWVVTVFGVLLGLRIKSQHKLYLIRKSLREEEVDYESNYEDLPDSTYSKMKAIIKEYNPVLTQIEEYDDGEEYDQLVAKQVDSVLFPPMKRDASMLFKSFVVFLWLGSILASFYAIYSIDFNTIIHAFQHR
ncbi:MAG: hypothetical protein H3C31_04310 [Brumimicrobium sp.]|nr:hypothetical protein [Brumimicrobium sp.]MCO5268862.1 hypothetical protein [Brumimicrobium sp.]